MIDSDCLTKQARATISWHALVSYIEFRLLPLFLTPYPEPVINHSKYPQVPLVPRRVLEENH